MYKRLLTLCSILALCSIAAAGGPWVWQGRIVRNGEAVTDTCSFYLSGWDALSGGASVGNPLTYTVAITNGRVALPISGWTGDTVYAQIAMQCTGDSSPITLSPRQKLSEQSSYWPTTLEALYATNAGQAITATVADTATYAFTAGSALTATTAGTADYATNSGYATAALTATQAITADYATTAGSANTAITATYATSGLTSTVAITAVYAETAGTATTATYALNSGGLITLSGTITQIAFFSGTNTLAGNAGLTWDYVGNTLILSGTNSQSAALLLARTGTTSTVFSITPNGALSLFGGGGAATATRFGASPALSAVRVNGAVGSESSVLSGQSVGDFVFRSFSGGSFPIYSSVGVGGVTAIAAEDHGGSNYGTYLRFTTVATGSASAGVRAIISPNGNLIVGTQTEAGTGASRVLGLHASVAPSTSPTDVVQLASIDLNGSGTRGLLIRSEDGVVISIGSRSTFSNTLFFGGVGVYSTTTTTVPNAGNLYVQGNLSADSITDRTPGFIGDALSLLDPITSTNGEIDHNTLPAFARRLVRVNEVNYSCSGTDADGNPICTPVTTQRTEINRSLGAMITLLTRGVQQLNNRLTTAPSGPLQRCIYGQYAADANYLYICIPNGTWKRLLFTAGGGW